MTGAPPKRLTLTQMKVAMQALCYDLRRGLTASEADNRVRFYVASFTPVMLTEFDAVRRYLEMQEPYAALIHAVLNDPEVQDFARAAAIKAAKARKAETAKQPDKAAS